MDPLLKKSLVRSYYFAEAIAFYQLYYSPIVKSFAPARKELLDSGRQQDRPPTWVPLVFHCTGIDDANRIVASGEIRPGTKGAVSLTEIPIGELDRMKYRKHDEDQVAFGFPRRYVESLGLTPVLYTKHNPALGKVLAKAMKSDRVAYGALAPLTEDDDVSPFNEVRTTSAIPVEQAVWLLTTRLDAEGKRPEFDGYDPFKKKYGSISCSYWHREHQMEMLDEWQFVSLRRNGDGSILDFTFLGEFYWRQVVLKEVEGVVSLPAHSRNLLFQISDLSKRARFDGPYNFIDVAIWLLNILRSEGESIENMLRYRMIENIQELH